MKQKNFTSFICALAFMGAIGLFYAFTTNAITQYTNPQPQWENLKVLPQDISRDSLRHLMKTYSKSVGVNCSHCHAPQKNDPEKLNFADDAKTAKLIARGMIQMTNDLNEKYFKPHYPDPQPTQVYDVSCVMCHRGTANPKKYLENIGDLYPSLPSEKH